MIFGPVDVEWAEPWVSFGASAVGALGLAVLLYLFATYWPELLSSGAR